MLFAALFLLWSLPWFAAAKFTFTSTAPTQCDNVQISWTGGSAPPYYLSIIPIFGVPRNISIPSTDPSGTFSTVIPLNSSDQVVLTLSDATGFGAGGSTQLLKVGDSLGGTCNTTAPALPFTFGLNSPLVQCQSFPITDYSSAIPPVSVIGVIPGGDSFVLNVPASQKSFDWTANVYNGTEIIFIMIDAQGRPGGSVLTTVGLSSDSSCINAQSPSSTVAPSSGSTSSSSPSSSSTVPATPSSNVGAIAGSVLGALIFLAVLITLGLFFLRQRQEKKNPRMGGGNDFRRSRPLNPSELDLSYDAQEHLNTSSFMSASATPTASTFDHAPPPAHYQPHSQYLSSRLPESQNPFNSPLQSTSQHTGIDPFIERESAATTSVGHRKSAMSGLTSYQPSRYIVHTDAEDEDLMPNEDGVIELPPQYSATRGPARGLPRSDASPPL